MKKILLSILTISAFAFYVVYQRMGWGSSVGPQLPGQNPAFTFPIFSNVFGNYKDGRYQGISVDAYYGRVEVLAIIEGGRIVDIEFLDYPHEQPTSKQINAEAMPMLETEAIVAQSAEVDIVSGATQTSKAFKESLASALAKAK